MTDWQIVRYGDYLEMPWKNGAGTTREILRYPDGDKPFQWRLSMATVAQSGSFSLYPGYQRLLSILEGEGLDLLIDGAATPTLRPFGLLSFSGDSQVESSLINGPLLDFNLIYTPRHYHAELRWLPLTGQEFSLHVQADTLLLFSATPQVCLANGLELGYYDTAFALSSKTQPETFTLLGDEGFVAIVTMTAVN